MLSNNINMTYDGLVPVNNDNSTPLILKILIINNDAPSIVKDFKELELLLASDDGAIAGKSIAHALYLGNSMVLENVYMGRPIDNYDVRLPIAKSMFNKMINDSELKHGTKHLIESREFNVFSRVIGDLYHTTGIFKDCRAGIDLYGQFESDFSRLITDDVRAKLYKHFTKAKEKPTTRRLTNTDLWYDVEVL